MSAIWILKKTTVEELGLYMSGAKRNVTEEGKALKEKSFFQNSAVQTIVTSLICILAGVLISYIVLLIIAPHGATQAIITIILNFLTRTGVPAQMKALGNTLVKTAPLSNV